LLLAGAVGCGARSGLWEMSQSDAGWPDAPDAVVIECETDEACEGFEDKCNPVFCNIDKGFCQTGEPVVCEDQDPCTIDECEPSKGTCVFTSATMDNDKDGHKGPLPGFAAGAPGSCGDDCDDTSPAAFPGNTEVCDGIDNDCNGVVDDGATFVPTGQLDVQVDQPGDDPAGPGGLAYSGAETSGYMSAYTATIAGKTKTLLQALSTSGDKLAERVQLTNINADASGGPLVWSGDRYGVAWMDRRHGDYEIYFNQLHPDGTKLYPDIRITNADGFSIYPSLAFNGLHFVVVWQDERDGGFAIWGQRIDLSGNLVGGNVKLVSQWGEAEAPSLAIGTKGMGIAWNHSDGSDVHAVRFRLFTPELAPSSDVINLTSSLSGVYPGVVWNKQSYVAAWFDKSAAPYAVYGSVIEESGAVTVASKLLTQSPKHSRYPSLLPLGDRLMMMYSDDRDNNTGHELYARMFTATLEPLSAETRVTNAIGDSAYPVPSFGPAGDMGVLFRDERKDGHHVYFTRLQCVGQ
jgi:hypothetical protein